MTSTMLAIQSLVVYMFCFKLFFYNLVLFIFSLKYLSQIQSQIFGLVTFIFSHTLYIFNVILLYLIFFLYSVSHTVQEDIVLQILLCSRFKNSQIKLRKCQIQKYKNKEKRIINSNKM